MFRLLTGFETIWLEMHEDCKLKRSNKMGYCIVGLDKENEIVNHLDDSGIFGRNDSDLGHIQYPKLFSSVYSLLKKREQLRKEELGDNIQLAFWTIDDDVEPLEKYMEPVLPESLASQSKRKAKKLAV